MTLQESVDRAEDVYLEEPDYDYDELEEDLEWYKSKLSECEIDLQLTLEELGYYGELSDRRNEAAIFYSGEVGRLKDKVIDQQEIIQDQAEIIDTLKTNYGRLWESNLYLSKKLLKG